MISEGAMQRMKAKVQQRVGSTPPSTWAKVGVGVLVGGVAIGWFAFPYVLDKVVASQINLAQGKDSRRLWVQLPTFGFLVYAFNVTNPTEVMRGARPVVQEVGPYCYKEVRDKIDFVEDPTTDTISYSARSTWYEDQQGPDCPAPYLTGDEVVTVPNVPILSILLIAEKDFPAPFLTLVSQALPAIFGRVSDLFMRVPVRKLLFDGILINCTASALYPRAVCIALKQNSRALKKISDNVYSFSFFGAKNHTPEEFRYTVKRGTVEGQEIGRMVAIDGKPELPFWRGDCNKIQGTDATVFPPFRKMENGSLMAYSSEVCRSIVGIFEGEADYKGVTGYVYAAYPFGDVETNPGDRCYCPADDRCRKKGVLDALKCQGAPIVVSHPHFYEASQRYVDGVIGLRPDKEKHGIKIMLEPISGSPLVVRKRIQFNIELKPIRFVPLTQRLRRTLVPLFWAEETLDLDGNLLGMLEASLFRPIRAVDVIKWLCVVGGVGLAVLGIVLKVRKYRMNKVHTIAGDIGTEYDYNGNSNSAKKPDTVENETEVLDPFYIKPQSNGKDNAKLTNGLQLDPNPKKSASTMTTPNVSRPNSISKLDVQQLMVRRNEKYPGKFIPNKLQAHNAKSDPFIDYGLENGLNKGDTQEVDIKSDTGNSKTLSSSSGNVLQNSTTVTRFHSPNIKASLEHQMYFRSPSNEPVYELPNLDENNEKLKENEFEDLSQTKFPVLDDNNTSGFNPNLRENLQTKTTDSLMQFENAFGHSIPVQDNLSDIGPAHRSSFENVTNVNEINGETVHQADEDMSEAQNVPKQENEEEIKAVEEDINRLMLEMAELLPRNKNLRTNDNNIT